MQEHRFATRGSLAVALVMVVVLAGIGVQRVASGWQTRRQVSTTASSTPEPAAGPGPTDDVVIVGDSITEQGVPVLETALGEPYHVRIRGRGGYRIEEMEPYAIELAATRPEQVIINLGSNDVLKNWPLDSSSAAMTRMLKTFAGARCVHVVTVNERFSTADDPGVSARAQVLNFDIRRLASTADADIIDWSSTVVDYLDAGQPEGDLTADTVHPTDLGQRKLAALYEQALDRCA